MGPLDVLDSTSSHFDPSLFSPSITHCRAQVYNSASPLALKSLAYYHGVVGLVRAQCEIGWDRDLGRAGPRDAPHTLRIPMAWQATKRTKIGVLAADVRWQLLSGCGQVTAPESRW